MTTSTDIRKQVPALLTPVVQAYERRLKRHGASPKGVYWRDAEWQQRRYHLLYQIFDEAAAAGGITIHDFGCGYGALFDYLKDRPVMLGSRYIGTDMCRGMVATAAARIDDPRAGFVRQLWADEVADYTIVSGTYNMHINAPLDVWQAYIETSLEQLWTRTRRGLAFNLLNADGTEKLDGLYYAEPERIFDFCATRLATDVSIATDPPLPDFTVFVRRR